MASLFVGNLHPDCTEATLYKKFSSVAKILNIHVCRKQGSETSLGYGYVNFANKDDAEIVINSMNYDPVKGQPIRLMWVNSNAFNRDANVFIKNLHESIDERALRDIFSCYGNILSSKVPKDEFGISKRIGYLQFEEESSANAAIDGVNDLLIKGLKVTVCKFLPKNKRSEKFTNIYLKPLHFDLGDKDLVELCEKFGRILSAKVMKDEKSQSRGFGFVNFASVDSAKEAVNKLNGTFFHGRVLYVGKAKRKSERQAEVMKNFKQKLHSAQI